MVLLEENMKIKVTRKEIKMKMLSSLDLNKHLPDFIELEGELLEEKTACGKCGLVVGSKETHDCVDMEGNIRDHQPRIPLEEIVLEQYFLDNDFSLKVFIKDVVVTPLNQLIKEHNKK